MVAVWLMERSIRVLLNAATVVLIVVSSVSLKPAVQGNEGSVLAISVFAIVPGEGEKGLFQSRTADLQSGKGGIARQQYANDRLRLTVRALSPFAFPFNLCPPGIWEKGAHPEMGAA